MLPRRRQSRLFIFFFIFFELRNIFTSTKSQLSPQPAQSDYAPPPAAAAAAASFRHLMAVSQASAASMATLLKRQLPLLRHDMQQQCAVQVRAEAAAAITAYSPPLFADCLLPDAAVSPRHCRHWRFRYLRLFSDFLSLTDTPAYFTIRRQRCAAFAWLRCHADAIFAAAAPLPPRHADACHRLSSFRFRCFLHISRAFAAIFDTRRHSRDDIDIYAFRALFRY